jgi:UDP-N-acetyl-D-galactosamine dehydrogenase
VARRFHRHGWSLAGRRVNAWPDNPSAFGHHRTARGILRAIHQPNPHVVTTIAVIGLGYVGLPLAVEFGKKYPTIGLDLSVEKIEAYRRHVDPTGEVSSTELKAALHLRPTTDASLLKEADFVVVAVPTPVDEAHIPDFSPLIGASTAAGKHLKRGAIVVYESTVYPGATEEVCVPLLEKHSGLTWQKDFFVGYSPERINPGDKQHTLTRITKVVSGDTPETLAKVAEIYASIITAGVHKASSIKVAEAAKVIENTQRDLNIALVNELSLIFHRIGIDTHEVLQAAGTKWNFLPFRPGLVGGHCIGVDPYYLTHKAETLGYHPQVILAGRRINDGMGKYIAEQTVKQMIRAGMSVKGAHVNVLGLTFKENCPDLRNSLVIDVIRELQSFGCTVHVHDPIAEAAEAEHEYGVKLVGWDQLPKASAIVAAVSHKELCERPVEQMLGKLSDGGVYVDVKCTADQQALRARGVNVWRL